MTFGYNFPISETAVVSLNTPVLAAPRRILVDAAMTLSVVSTVTTNTAVCRTDGRTFDSQLTGLVCVDLRPTGSTRQCPEELQ